MLYPTELQAPRRLGRPAEPKANAASKKGSTAGQPRRAIASEPAARGEGTRVTRLHEGDDSSRGVRVRHVGTSDDQERRRLGGARYHSQYYLGVHQAPERVPNWLKLGTRRWTQSRKSPSRHRPHVLALPPSRVADRDGEDLILAQAALRP